MGPQESPEQEMKGHTRRPRAQAPWPKQGIVGSYGAHCSRLSHERSTGQVKLFLREERIQPFPAFVTYSNVLRPCFARKPKRTDQNRRSPTCIHESFCLLPQ